MSQLSRTAQALGAALVLLVGSAQSQTVVVNFDDLGTGIGALPATYGGINWVSGTGSTNSFYDNNWYWWSPIPFGNPGFPPSSPQNEIFTYATVAPFTFISGPVVFDGAYLVGPLTGGSLWRLYLNNILVFTSAPSPSNTNFDPIFFASGYSGLVDRVEWNVESPGGVGLDDVTYSTVPEPATMTLLATGLVGMVGAGVRRRRKKAGFSPNRST